MELKRLRERLYLLFLVRSGRLFTLTREELHRMQH
jgi:hypothetical protein